LDLTTVLRSNPIELESVGDPQGELAKVLLNLRYQRSDPGIELLLRQILSQLLEAKGPKFGRCGGVCCLMHGGS
jgi:hypothetical protein